MKSSYSRCRKVQKFLLHSKRFYCRAENFTTQQKVLQCSKRFYCVAGNFTAQQKILLRSRKFYCTAKSFTTQQKSRFCDRNQRKVPSTAKVEDKPTLQCLPLDFDSTFGHKLAMAKCYFGAHSTKRQTQLPSQKKPRLSIV